MLPSQKRAVAVSAGVPKPVHFGLHRADRLDLAEVGRPPLAGQSRRAARAELGTLFERKRKDAARIRGSRAGANAGGVGTDTPGPLPGVYEVGRRTRRSSSAQGSPHPSLAPRACRRFDPVPQSGRGMWPAPDRTSPSSGGRGRRARDVPPPRPRPPGMPRAARRDGRRGVVPASNRIDGIVHGDVHDRQHAGLRARRRTSL